MGGEWPTVRLGDVIELKRGYDLPQQDRLAGAIPIVSSSGVSGRHAEPKVAAPGVVTGRYGTLGQVFYMDEDFWPLNTTLYVRDFKGNDPKFISYLLRTIDFGSCSDKGAVPGVNRNHLHELLVRFPPLAEQRRIAHILGSLDDKIELNRRTNETLEEIARALFKSWFIDFDPVHAKAAGRAPVGMSAETAALFSSEFEDSELGPIPKGWRMESLDAIAQFRNGLALQNFRPGEGGARLPVVKIAQLRTGKADSGEWARADIEPSCVIHDGDVIFSWSGSLTVVLWCGGKAALNQHLFRVSSELFPRWFYYQWLTTHLSEFQRIASDKATTMGHIQRHHLTAAKCIVPSAELLAALSESMSALLQHRVGLELENRAIAAMRDELLPKLLAGDVSAFSPELGDRVSL